MAKLKVSRKLSDLSISNIKKLQSSGRFTMDEIADMYGVCKATIWNVVHGRTRGGDGPRKPRPKLACVAERDRKLAKAVKKIKSKLPTTFVLDVESSVDVTRRLHKHVNVRNGTWRKVGVRRVQQILRAAGFRKRVCPKTATAYRLDVQKRLAFGKGLLKVFRPLQSLKDPAKVIPCLEMKPGFKRSIRLHIVLVMSLRGNSRRVASPRRTTRA